MDRPKFTKAYEENRFIRKNDSAIRSDKTQCF